MNSLKQPGHALDIGLLSKSARVSKSIPGFYGRKIFECKFFSHFLLDNGNINIEESDHNG